MVLEVVLPALALALVAAGVLTAFRLRAVLANLKATVERGQADTLRALCELEHYVACKLDRLPAALRTEPREELVLAPLVAALTEMSRREPPAAPEREAGGPEGHSRPQTRTAGPSEAPEREDREPDGTAGAEAVAPLPVFPPSASEAQGRKRGGLRLVLDSPDFLDAAWPHLDGPFETARARVLDHLIREGLEPPRVVAHPPVDPETSNHWLFLVVQGHAEGGERFLIPRTFSRYDPAVHDHLFEVPGRVDSLDHYVRRCRKVAVLQPAGDLQGFIDRRLVERRGEILV